MKDKKCAVCGQGLPRGSELEVDWSALSRARKRLELELGWGIPDETYKRNNRKLNNNKKTKGERK